MCQEYNGWSNRETWATMLWIDNEQGLQERALEFAREELDGHDEGEEINSYHLGETIKEFFDELFDMDSLFENRELITMMTDIGSLYRVNWREIADALLTTAKEEAALNA